jgi:acyl-CoA thioesterase I
MPEYLRFDLVGCPRSSPKNQRIGRHCLTLRWRIQVIAAVAVACVYVGFVGSSAAVDPAAWEYSPELLRPFWTSDNVYRESVLFIRDAETGESKARVLFPIRKILSVQDSSGTVTYEPGADYHHAPGSNEIWVPANSRIVTKTAADLRRPANSQQFRLTHRDGNGEILFGGKLEYHTMQTWITYSKATSEWPVAMPTFDPSKLPRTIERLKQRQPISVVLLGDSISTGCNASGWGNGAPFQPAYQDLLKARLETHYSTTVKLTNLAVGGTSTPWGITQIPEVLKAEPDLIILAFGMNDSAGRSSEEFGKNISQMISTARKTLPNVEFILVASMLGNRDWTALNHDVFPKNRDELASLCKPGIALADMTSVWHEFLIRKSDHDLTGNGVNHPNDFGHRVYAQVLSALLVEDEKVVDLRIGTQPVNRILFLGNSITLHGPAPQIGWTGNWGMAATSEDKDYVHVLINRITEAAGGSPQVKVKNIAEFERRLTDYNIPEELKPELAFNADLIIIALGENSPAPTTEEVEAQFASAFDNLFTELQKHGKPTLMVRSQFWHDATKDRLMKQACEKAAAVYIDISPLGFDATNFARAERTIEHAGVAGHPGDKGMLGLANALWSALQKHGTPTP